MTKTVFRLSASGFFALFLAVIIMALQTPPDQAISNAGLWFEKLAGYAPPWLKPESADTWATIIFSVLLGAVLLSGWQAFKKWRGGRATATAAPLNLELADEVAPTSDAQIQQRLNLTGPERLRISTTLLSTLDWLDGDFETFIKPIKDVRTWRGALMEQGPDAVMAMTELARTRVQEMSQLFGSAFGRERMADLDLVGINPMLIKSKAILMGDTLHSLASIAYAMKPDEPNEAAFGFTSNAFLRLFEQFEKDIDQTKDQIRDVRRKMAQGEL